MSPRSSNRSGRSNPRDQREENKDAAPEKAVEEQTSADGQGVPETVSDPTSSVKPNSAEVGAVDEAKPVALDASVAETKPVDAKASDAKVGDAKASDAKVGDAKVGDAKASDAKASDAKASDAKASDTKASDTKANDAKSNASLADAKKIATNQVPPAVPPNQPTVDKPASRPSKLGVVLALLALIGVGVLAWQVYDLRENATALKLAADEVRQEAAQRISATDAVAVEARTFANRTSEAFDGMQRRFGAVEARVADMEGQTAALEAVYLAATRSRSDQLLAEVEQAINAAAQQLQMAANVEAAVIALEGVEARLAQPEFGHMHALRRALVRDLETLRALPRVDVGGIALRLELVLERIDSLPLAFETMLAEREEDSLRIEVAKAQGEKWEWTVGMLKELGADVWNEVKGMVRLERIDGGDPVLLSPDQTTFLRENIKMRLLTARLALLSRDGKTYSSDVDRAREWMERYFDMASPQVQQSVKELSELAVVPMRVEMPSLLDTFSALRVVQARGATDAESAPASGASR